MNACYRIARLVTVRARGLALAMLCVTALLVPASSAFAQKAGDTKTVMIPGPEGEPVALEMVYIPGGTFKMGSTPDEIDEFQGEGEGPQITVKVDPFWMGKYEITWEQFKVFSGRYDKLKNAGVIAIPEDKQADAVSFPTPVYPQDAVPIYEAMGWGGKFPLSDITQLTAKQFTKWLTLKTGKYFRLPTEAEWEYAARAGTTTPYYFGDDPFDLEDHGYHYDNSEWDDPLRGHPKAEGRGYHEVGSLKDGKNPWGLYDMYGNVAEWVIDQYDPNHYKALKDKYGDKPIDWKDAVNWPKTEYPRVVRGGHWDSDAENCRSASRLG